ncbi:MAG: ribonuclease III [Lentisphaerae bacterium]|nr:ribonuclease III [Lentisphaerota bacterium]MCP4101886.1 ribonuclease III [Lentisphaerota bacterium]
MAEDIEKFKKQIDYNFKNKALLREALTHRTYAVENDLKYDNQRLEFLGDAVLEIILSEYLFNLYPNAAEGEMTKMRSAMVNQDSLAILARKMDFGKFLLAGKGEIESGGCERDSTLSDLFEAITGAFYLDAGFETIKKFIIELFKKEFPEPEKLLLGLNPKGMLQEYSQKKWGEAPAYEVINVSGPDHNPLFEVEVKVGQISATGQASSRKNAESQAAKTALLRLAESDKSLMEMFS